MEIAMMVSVEILVGMSKELCLEPFCKYQFTVSPDGIAYRLWRGSVNTTIMIRREVIYEKKNR